MEITEDNVHDVNSICEPTADLKKLMLISNKIYAYGDIDEDHHKQWLFDQIIRIIHGDNYQKWVEKYCDGEQGPNTYEWDRGTPP